MNDVGWEAGQAPYAAPGAPSWAPPQPITYAVEARRKEARIGWRSHVAVLLLAFGGGLIARPTVEEKALSWLGALPLGPLSVAVETPPRPLVATAVPAAPAVAAAVTPVTTPPGDAPTQPTAAPAVGSAAPTARPAAQAAAPRPVTPTAAPKIASAPTAPPPAARAPATIVHIPPPTSSRSAPVRLRPRPVAVAPRRTARADQDPFETMAPTKSRASGAASRAPLTRQQVAAQLRGIRPEIDACGKRFGGTGPVDLKLAVAASGDVESLSIKGASLGKKAGACIEEVVLASSFPASSSAQAFAFQMLLR